MHVSSRWFLPALLVACLLPAASARAATIALDTPISFNAPLQSLWGSASTPGFDTGGSFGSTLGTRWDVSLGSGIITVDFSGNLQVQYPDSVAGTWTPTFSLTSTHTRMVTSVGGSASVDGFVHVAGLDADFTIAEYNVGIVTRADQAGASAQTTTHPCAASQLDRVNCAQHLTSATVSVPQPIPGTDIGAGVSGDINQTASFTADSVLGNVVAVHRGTGTTRSALVGISASGSPTTASLGLGGYYGEWDIQLRGLTLVSHFTTSFSLGIDPLVYYQIYLPFFGNCGDPVVDDDGTVCFAEDYASWHGTGIDLYSSGPSSLNSFSRQGSVNLGTVNVTPEPGTVVLVLTAGLLMLVVTHRRRVRTQSVAAATTKH